MTTQRWMMDLAMRSLAERDEVFLELLPTITRAELELLIATKPERWARYARFLNHPLPSEVP